MIEKINDALNLEIETRRRVERSLRKNKERLELAQRVGNIGAFEWDIKNDRFLWSNELKDLYGVSFKNKKTSFAEWINKTHPLDIKYLQDSIDSIFDGTKELHAEFRIIWPDNGIRFMTASAEAFFDKKSKPINIVGVIRDITERKQAENSLRFLVEVSTELTASLDYQTTLDTITRLAVPTLADWCAVDILEKEGNIRRLSVAHYDPVKEEVLYTTSKKYSDYVNSLEGVGKVIHTGKSEVYTDISDELLRVIAHSEERFKLLKEIGFNSCMIVPLIRKGVCLGTIKFVLENKDRKYIKSDLTLAEDLAYKAAMAVENAQLYNAERIAREEAQAAKEQKEVLLKEIHHRVKNNLQVISSLLNLQSTRIKDQKYLEIFKESQNRIRSMSLVHEKLYQSEDLSHIDFGQYVHSITSNLFRSYSSKNNSIRMEIINPDPIFLNIDRATTCGLIINELISNSLKYAFPENKSGKIIIKLGYNKKMMYVEVKDNGVGVPKDFDINNTKSLGMTIITTLTNQLSGKFKLKGSKGTSVRIEFPVLDKIYKK